jgi:hypothetical protein
LFDFLKDIARVSGAWRALGMGQPSGSKRGGDDVLGTFLTYLTLAGGPLAIILLLASL